MRGESLDAAKVARMALFEEDQWLGGVLTFGEADDAPAMTVTMRDIRCAPNTT